MSELWAMDAAALSSAYQSGELSPVDVTQAVFSRIDAWEPSINAMYRLRRESALASAEQSQARWKSGQALGALDGVPLTIKENIDTVGDPTPLGNAVTALVDKTVDAPQAARPREAGCVILGKTTMPDYGMLSAGISSIHGITRNPWQLDRNTSGSSAGAGAAGAAGYGPLHIGTDIGGSVRLPAAHCGLFGLKPSQGRIPVSPPYMGRCSGPMTRTVRDAAMLLEVMSQPDARDYSCLPHQPESYVQQLESFDVKGLRIGLMTQMNTGLPAVDAVDAVVQASTEACQALESAGAIVEPLASFMTDDMLDGICQFFEARSCNDVLALSDADRARILPFIVEWCTHRAKNFTGAQVMAAYTQVVAMREAAVRITQPYDFVISPVSPILPYEAEFHCPGNDATNALPHIAFTVPYNMSEQPASSINWHHTEAGLPVGVQVVGRRFDDLGVLQLSRVIEQLRPTQRSWPEPV